MDHNTLLNQQEELFRRMRTECPTLYPHFIGDGAVNPEQFFRREPRIVFLAKDPNYKRPPNGETRDLFEKIRSGGEEGEFALSKWRIGGRVLSRWLSEIHGDNLSWEELEHKSNKIMWCLDKFQSLALVNIKKTAGRGINPEKQLGEYRAELDRHASEAGPLLADQVRLYDPVIVVACGTGHGILEHLFPKINLLGKRTRRGWDFYEIGDERFRIVTYYHFSGRTDSRMLHYGLVDAIKEIVDSTQ